ncbi:MAG TPA: hypothetical protein PK289_10240 [Bacteroidia bacterium]|jgi:hypothetical protein|nr:hypothetical protein [Bacteroidia bacterium]HRG51333.1 hypothetical protein [Bacteroidia bacterium]
MFKFDRSYSKSSNHKTFVKESEHYKGFTIQQIAEVFLYLQSVAYNYDLSNPPRMDKTIYSSGKL